MRPVLYSRAIVPKDDIIHLIEDAAPALRTVMAHAGAWSWEERDGAIYILKPKGCNNYVWVEVPQALLVELGRSA